MAVLATLVASLKEVANVTANDVISDTLAGTFLTQALAQHNPLYSVASLPAREEEAVQILAWIKVCLKRASNVVSQQTAHGPAGFGQDRETPYRKNMDMVAQLQRHYQAVCGRLGLSNDGTGVTVSFLTTLDDRTDAVTPLSLEPVVGPLVLTVTQSTSNLSIFDFTWNFPAFDNFDSVQLFMVERTVQEVDDTLYQEWNYESDTGIPRLLNGATLLVTVSRADQKSVRVTELDITKCHRFLAVLKTRSGHYAYSEEYYGIADCIPAVPAFNYTLLKHWIVTSGRNVDLIGKGFNDVYPGSGFYVDMAGTASSTSGIITSRSTFSLATLRYYTFSWQFAGNHRLAQTDEVRVTIRNVATGAALFTQLYTLAYMATWTTYTTTFTPLVDTVVAIEFENTRPSPSSDLVGMLLRHISFVRVLDDYGPALTLLSDDFECQLPA